MTGLVKQLVFSEGVGVTSPTDQGIESVKLKNYATDAAYEAVWGSGTDGDEYWNTTDNKHRIYNGGISDWQDGGGGAGAGEINYITNSDGESNTTGWETYDDGASATPVDGTGGTSANLTLTVQETTVLRGTKSFKLAKGAADAQGEGTSFDFVIPKADEQKLLKIEFDYNTDASYAADDLAVYIYDITNATLITPSVTGITGWDKDNDGSGHGLISWSSTDSNSYRLIFHVTSTNASAWDFYFENVIVGPSKIVTGAIVGSNTTYDASSAWNGDASIDAQQWYYYRVGSNMIIKGYVDFNGAGTVNSDKAFTLPESLTIDSSSMSVNNSRAQGWVGSGGYYDLSATDQYRPMRVNAIGGGTVLNFVLEGTEDIIRDNEIASGDWISFHAEVPIAEWAGSGTVNLGANDVEYAFNTDVSDANDTTSFGYGPEGTPLPGSTFTAVRDKTVQFLTPKQSTDTVELQVQSVVGGAFVTVASVVGTSTGSSQALQYQNGVYYGIGFRSVGTDSAIVRLGQYRINTSTYGAAGSNWDSTSDNFNWRVVKHRSGIATGFGLADADNAGLVSNEEHSGEGDLGTITNWTSTPPTSAKYRWSKVAGVVTFKFRVEGAGSSNSQALTFTIPSDAPTPKLFTGQGTNEWYDSFSTSRFSGLSSGQKAEIVGNVLYTSGATWTLSGTLDANQVSVIWVGTWIYQTDD